MPDMLSILYESAMDLPSTPEAKEAARRAKPFHSRLCELTSEQEADEIWFAAIGEGAAESAAAYRRGFAAGVRLWEQAHEIPLSHGDR